MCEGVFCRGGDDVCGMKRGANHPGDRQAFQAVGIELVVLPTQRAVEIHNAMREGQAIVAAVHLTC